MAFYENCSRLVADYLTRVANANYFKLLEISTC